MAWTEVCISVLRADAAHTEAVLEQLGALAITLEDDADSPVLEPGPGMTPLWPDVHLRGLFDANVDRGDILAALQEVPGAERPGNLRWREVGDQDWERAWMDRFQPMCFGDHLWIVPTGMTIPPNAQSTEIRLDPGLAFGTGTHPTTALCLEWLDGQSCAQCFVVDYGCGSGILGIAAALKGAAAVAAVDNDPQALQATTDNARRNGVDDVVQACLPEDFHTQGADIVIANILAGPLIELAPSIEGCARSGARIVLSGLLEEQVDNVLNAYRTGCREAGVQVLEGWARLDLIKR